MLCKQTRGMGWTIRSEQELLEFPSLFVNYNPPPRGGTRVGNESEMGRPIKITTRSASSVAVADSRCLHSAAVAQVGCWVLAACSEDVQLFVREMSQSASEVKRGYGEFSSSAAIGLLAVISPRTIRGARSAVRRIGTAKDRGRDAAGALSQLKGDSLIDPNKPIGCETRAREPMRTRGAAQTQRGLNTSTLANQLSASSAAPP